MKKFIFLFFLLLTIACAAQNVSYRVSGDSLFVRYRVVGGSYIQTKISPVTGGIALPDSTVFTSELTDSLNTIRAITDSLAEDIANINYTDADTILSGTATIIYGNSYVIVTHGLGFTPEIKNMNITPNESLGGLDYWITDISSTTFKIQLDTVAALYDVGQAVTFSWQIFNADLSVISDSLTAFIRSQKTVSVLQFDGVYNDSTHGDTNGEAITAASLWASQNGYALIFPAGKYYIGNNERIRLHPNSVIIGTPSQSIIYSDSTASMAIRLDNAYFAGDSTLNNIYIYGMTVIGKYDFADTYLDVLAGIYIRADNGLGTQYKLNNVYIEKCVVQKTGGEGIVVVGHKTCWIQDCVTENMRFTGLTTLGNTTYLINNYMNKVNFGIEAHGVNVWDDGTTPLLYISGNKIYSAYYSGITARGLGIVNIDNNLIEGDDNSYKSTPNIGINIASAHSIGWEYGVTKLFSITNNIIRKQYSSIFVDWSSVWDTIYYLEIKNNLFEDTWSGALNLQDTTSSKYLNRIEIKNNIFNEWLRQGGTGYSVSAIRLEGVNYAEISNNKFFKKSSGQKDYLYLKNSDYTIFKDNNLIQPVIGSINIDSLSTDYRVYGNEGFYNNPEAIRFYDQTPITYEPQKQDYDLDDDGVVDYAVDLYDYRVLFDYYIPNPQAGDTLVYANQFNTNVIIDSVRFATKDSSISVNILSSESAFIGTNYKLFSSDKVITDKAGIFHSPDTNRVSAYGFIKIGLSTVDGDSGEALSVGIYAHKEHLLFGSELFANGTFESYEGIIDDDISDDFTGHAESLTGGRVEATNTSYNGVGIKLTDTTAAAGGSYIANGTSTGVIVGEAEYRLTFYTRGDGTNQGRFRLYDVDNTTDIAYENTGITSIDYTKVTYDFVSPAGCESINWFLYSADAENSIVYYDNISLKRIISR